jgi:hypothetical protein
LQTAVSVRFGVVNGATDEGRTPKVKPAETLSQVVQLVNNDGDRNGRSSGKEAGDQERDYGIFSFN